MTELILCLFVNELIILGIYAATDDGMIFEFVGDFFVWALGDKWSKPFTECLPCMASVHGSWFWLLVYGFPGSIHETLWSFAYIFALCGMGLVASKLVVKPKE